MKHFYVVLLLNLLGAYPIMTHSPSPRKYIQTEDTHTHPMVCTHTKKTTQPRRTYKCKHANGGLLKEKPHRKKKCFELRLVTAKHRYISQCSGRWSFRAIGHQNWRIVVQKIRYWDKQSKYWHTSLIAFTSRPLRTQGTAVSVLWFIF